MATFEELAICLPNELASKFKGLAVDAGITLTKFIYRSKDDKIQSASPTSRLRCVSFARGQLAEGLEFIRQRADVIRDNGKQNIVTTGVSMLQIRQQICQMFHIETESVSEADLNPAALFYLACHLPRTQLLHPFIHEAVPLTVSQLKNWLGVMQSCRVAGVCNVFKAEGRWFEDGLRRIEERASSAAAAAAAAVNGSNGDVNAKGLVDAESDAFPCMLVMCGSATVYTQIERDGSCQSLEVVARSSRSFLGLGHLLTGAKTFTELVDLASKGDPRNIDMYTDQLAGDKPADDEPDMYDIATGSSAIMVSQFAHVTASNKDALRPEDKARSLLGYCASELVEHAQYLCRLRGIKRVYFAGGFCDHPFLRSVITQEFVYRVLMQMVYIEEDFHMDVDFVRPGSYLGAIGCILKDFNQANGKTA